MPTNDERRKVAKGIRSDDAFWHVVKKDIDAYRHYLADLIEPEPERTCCIDDSGYCGCGYPLGDWVTWRMDDSGVYLYERANYCPNCGAKVVE